jgi:hypothetical protein
MLKQNFEHSSYYHNNYHTNGKNSKSMDIVLNEIYHSTPKEIMDTFIDCTKTDFYRSIKSAIDNPAVYKAMIGGTTLSFFSNSAGAEYAANHNFTFNGIDLTSFIFEVIPHLCTSAYIFWTESRKAGRSRKDTMMDMFIVGAVTIPLSVLVYRPLRNIVSNNLMYNGVAPEKATLRAQAELIWGYMVLATATSNYALKKLNRLGWKEEALKDMEASKREISMIVDEVIIDFKKKKDYIDKNNHIDNVINDNKDNIVRAS